MNTAPTDPTAYRFEVPAPALEPGAGAISRTFSGVAYSGDVIPGHWQFGALVIDLAGISLPSPCPTLLEHDRAKRVGVCALSVEGGALRCQGRLLSNPVAAQLAADADDGFPWQLSIHADPTTIEEVLPGAEVSVNGRTFAGPCTVFRGVRIRELSFTPTGYDYRTEARVLAVPADSPASGAASDSDPNEDRQMTIEELQAQLSAATARAEQAETAAAEARTRAETAETALAEHTRSVRLAAVTATFTALGREITPEAMQPYLSMDAATWERVAADLSGARPEPPAHLFSEQATDGVNHQRQRGDDELVARMAKL